MRTRSARVGNEYVRRGRSKEGSEVSKTKANMNRGEEVARDKRGWGGRGDWLDICFRPGGPRRVREPQLHLDWISARVDSARPSADLSIQGDSGLWISRLSRIGVWQAWFRSWVGWDSICGLIRGCSRTPSHKLALDDLWGCKN